MSGGRSVLFCGAWDDGDGYPRTEGLRQGIERAGHEVLECRLPGIGRSKQTLLRRPWRWPAAAIRAFGDRRRLQRDLGDALRRHTPRCVVVPYPGHHLVAAVSKVSKAMSRAPVVLDLFLSAYDTVVEDRRLCRPGSIGAWAMRELDVLACSSADLVLVDTPENAAYVATLTGLPAERFAWLPLSDPHAGEGALPRSPASGLRVLFFGTGVPLHGLDVLVDAVAAAPGVRLTIVGGTAGDRAGAVRALGDRVDVLSEFVDRRRLRELMARCDVVAGVFGAGGKAQRVVPWKVVIALAAGRPVITADTPAACGWLEGSDAVWLSPAGDAVALAAKLRELADDPDAVDRATAAARATYDRHFAAERAATRWQGLLERAECVA